MEANNPNNGTSSTQVIFVIQFSRDFFGASFDMVSMLDNHLANSMPMIQVWWLPMVPDVKTHQQVTFLSSDGVYRKSLYDEQTYDVLHFLWSKLNRSIG